MNGATFSSWLPRIPEVRDRLDVTLGELGAVLLGTGLLTFVWARARRGAVNSANLVVPESVASFWHLVDLLWIVLFPLLYLMKAQ